MRSDYFFQKILDIIALMGHDMIVREKGWKWVFMKTRTVVILSCNGFFQMIAVYFILNNYNDLKSTASTMARFLTLLYAVAKNLNLIRRKSEYESLLVSLRRLSNLGKVEFSR